MKEPHGLFFPLHSVSAGGVLSDRRCCAQLPAQSSVLVSASSGSPTLRKRAVICDRRYLFCVPVVHALTHGSTFRRFLVHWITPSSFGEPSLFSVCRRDSALPGPLCAPALGSAFLQGAPVPVGEGGPRTRAWARCCCIAVTPGRLGDQQEGVHPRVYVPTSARTGASSCSRCPLPSDAARLLFGFRLPVRTPTRNLPPGTLCVFISLSNPPRCNPSLVPTAVPYPQPLRLQRPVWGPWLLPSAPSHQAVSLTGATEPSVCSASCLPRAETK